MVNWPGETIIIYDTPIIAVYYTSEDLKTTFFGTLGAKGK